MQTCSPDHPAIVAAVTGDVERFVAEELAERREAGYPPFRRLATLLFAGADEARVEDAAEACAEAIRPDAETRRVEVLGPRAPPKLCGETNSPASTSFSRTTPSIGERITVQSK